MELRSRQTSRLTSHVVSLSRMQNLKEVGEEDSIDGVASVAYHINWQRVAASSVDYVRIMLLQWVELKLRHVAAFREYVESVRVSQGGSEGTLQMLELAKNLEQILSATENEFESDFLKGDVRDPFLVLKGEDIVAWSSGSSRLTTLTEDVDNDGDVAREPFSPRAKSTYSALHDKDLERFLLWNPALMRQKAFEWLCGELGKQLFRVLDRDADGAVTCDEMRRAFQLVPQSQVESLTLFERTRNFPVPTLLYSLLKEHVAMFDVEWAQRAHKEGAPPLPPVLPDDHVSWERTITASSLVDIMRQNPRHENGFIGDYAYAVSFLLQVFRAKNETCLTSVLLIPFFMALVAAFAFGGFLLLQRWWEWKDLSINRAAAYDNRTPPGRYIMIVVAVVHVVVALFAISFRRRVSHVLPYIGRVVGRVSTIASVYAENVIRSATANVTRVHKARVVFVFHVAGIVILLNFSMVLLFPALFTVNFLSVCSYCGCYVAWLIVFALQLLSGSVHRTNKGQLAYIRSLAELKYFVISEHASMTEVHSVPKTPADVSAGLRTGTTAWDVVHQIMSPKAVREALVVMVASRSRVKFVMYVSILLTFALGFVILPLPYLFLDVPQMHWRPMDALPLVLHFICWLCVVISLQIELLESIYGLLRAACGVRQVADLLNVNAFTSAVVFLDLPSNLRAWRAILYHVREFEYYGEYARSGRVVSVFSIMFAICSATVIAIGPRMSFAEPLYACAIIGAQLVAFFSGVQLVVILWSGSLVDREQKGLVKALLDERLNLRLRRAAAATRAGQHLEDADSNGTSAISLMTDTIENVRSHSEPVRLLGVLPLTQQTVSGLITSIISLTIASTVRVFGGGVN